MVVRGEAPLPQKTAGRNLGGWCLALLRQERRNAVVQGHVCIGFMCDKPTCFRTEQFTASFNLRRRCQHQKRPLQRLFLRSRVTWGAQWPRTRLTRGEEAAQGPRRRRRPAKPSWMGSS